jgi:hypothetical protein
MGGTQSTVAANIPEGPCRDNILQIQSSLMTTQEFSSKKVQITGLSQLANANGQAICQVNLQLIDRSTNIVSNTLQNITLDQQSNGTYTITSIASPEVNTAKRISTPDEINKYYEKLHSYNNAWIAFRWKTADLYDPPRPLWSDPLFEKNIGLYNTVYAQIMSNYPNLQAIESASNGYDQVNLILQKYLSPLPADPIPPAPNMITVPQMMQSSSASSSASSSTSANNMIAAQNIQSHTNNLESYNVFLSPDDPDYDPPQLGDDYETILIKYNKSYDAATLRNVSKADMDSASRQSEQDRRLIRRVTNGVAYRVPDPVYQPMPINSAERYKSYKFNERQKYLIDYSPVSGPNKNLLIANFCTSLGYQPYSDKLPGCEPGDCCAPMPTAPRYSVEDANRERITASGSAKEGFANKCKGISLAGRTTTISVPRPPITIENENNLNIYRVDDPAVPKPNKCVSGKKSTAEPSIDQLYEVIRPAFIKEIQQALKGDKLFSLRCPASCV